MSARHFPGCWPAALCVASLLLATVGMSAELEPRQFKTVAPADANDVASLQALAEAKLLRARTRPDARDAIQAEALIQRALRLAPRQQKSWELQAWLETSRHRFRQALAALEQARRIAPLSALGLGLQADALVELGRYGEALETIQMLMDLHPGLSAYSRAAHLRFLHGDLPGAIELMQGAVMAGRPRTEEAAWTLTQLSVLYQQDGQIAEAEQSALAAIRTFPGLAAATAQLGRLRAAQDRLDAALALYRQAARLQLNPEYAFDVYELARRLQRPLEVRRQAALLEAMARLDEQGGGLNRRLFARFYTTLPGRMRDAERLARLEMRERPDIYSADALAWVLCREGKIAEASQWMQQALRLGTPDRELRQHADTILGAAQSACG